MTAKVLFFDAHHFEREVFEKQNKLFNFQIDFLETRLTPETAKLAHSYEIICCFANDRLNADSLRILKQSGVKLIALRSAGFNHIDLGVAHDLNLVVVRVPEYSPFSVAEHAACMLLALNRKIHRSYHRVRELNFSLEGLVGFDLHGKSVGVLGTGRIGSAFARIMRGFGCHIYAYDPKPNSALERELQLKYVDIDTLFSKSKIISLHLPLVPETKHLIDKKALQKMQPGVYLINTGRGALIDTLALIQALKTGHVGAAGLDVYEEEENIFFKDLSDQVLLDDHLARLLTFPNVLITSHQGFLTAEALTNIAQTTLENIADFNAGRPLKNQIRCS